MKYILLLLTISLLAINGRAQYTVPGYPQSESDSTYNGSGGFTLVYNIAHHYNANFLDTLSVFTNASGLYMQNLRQWPAGTSNQFAIGRSPETRPEIITNQHYTSGSWVNYSKDIEVRFTNTCFDSILYGVYWTGSAWTDTQVGERSTAVWNAGQQPSNITTLDYDTGTGLWMNFRNNNYYYDGSGHLRSTHYRQYSQPTASSYVDYIDSNYSFTSYNNICDYQLDTLITYKKSGSATTYSPYLKTKRITYPYGGYKMYLLQWNGSSYDSLSIYEKLYDAHGNDSLYYAWQWNSTLHMFKIESHDEYINTYDASFNLMKQLRMSNYQTVNKDSIQPYTKKIFGNYIAGGVVNVVKDYDPNSDYKIYPNPSDGRIHVWMNPEWAQDADMQLYDLTGKMIRHEQLTQPLSDFDLQVQAGLYIMTLQHGDKKII